MSSRKIWQSVRFTSLGLAAGALLVWFWTSKQEQAGQPAPTIVRGTQEAGATATWYTCGMHPEVVQDHPGDCPKCGMKLQPMAQDRAAAMGLTGGEGRSEGKGRGAGEGGGAIRIDPVTEQNMGVRVDEVIRGPLSKTVRTVGFVAYDETSLATVTTKVDGWVEKLHVDQTGLQVHAGDRLFELYSPELFSAQEEYLAALRNVPAEGPSAIPRARVDSQAMVRDARTRLEFFDISADQIGELERTKKVRKTLTIRAPFTGIITHKNVVQGQKITAGMDVFSIADLSNVWVIAKVFESDLPYVRLGQEAFMTLSYVPGKTFRGRVTYVYPYLEEQTRELSVRMEFHNPGYELKPGMYATVTLTSELAREATLVPDLAVIDTGLRAVAFVRTEPGRFEPRELSLGARGEGNYLQVLSGLAPGETVVVSGQFLLDSESRLREAALKFMEAGTVEAGSPIKAATQRSGTAPALQDVHGAEEGRLYYVCPMPEHVDILYEGPGKCPLCGMELVPVRRHAGHVESPKVSHWTCPMPEHASVREPGPGKCPICGMSLIPVPQPEPSPLLQSDKAASYWTCPMDEHASVREDGPGKCPLCGMDLVEKNSESRIQNPEPRSQHGGA